MSLWRQVVTINDPVLGGTGTNTWHARTSNDIELWDLELPNLQDMLHTFYNALSGVYHGGAVIHASGDWQGVHNDEGSFRETDAWTVTGGGGENAMPPANCICVSWRGQSGDRSKRGRTFIGPLALPVVQSDGTPNTAHLATVRDAATNLVGSSTGAGNSAFGVFSRQEGMLRDFVASSVRDKFAVLRSRRD